MKAYTTMLNLTHVLFYHISYPSLSKNEDVIYVNLSYSCPPSNPVMKSRLVNISQIIRAFNCQNVFDSFILSSLKIISFLTHLFSFGLRHDDFYFVTRSNSAYVSRGAVCQSFLNRSYISCCFCWQIC